MGNIRIIMCNMCGYVLVQCGEGITTSARRILLKALAIEASIPIISNSMSSSPSDTTSTRNPCVVKHYIINNKKTRLPP